MTIKMSETERPTGRMNFGRHWSYNLHNDPKRLAFVLARYRFAASMLPSGKSLLELGCSEGIGLPLLCRKADSYTGIDYDASAIVTAQKNYSGERHRFVHDDFMGKRYGYFGGVVSLDVIEHIDRRYENQFLETVCLNLDHDGVCVIGTPNVTSEQYASEASRTGHINLYDAPRLAALLEQEFANVFMFGMNDEVAHVGFNPMAHYLMAVGCNRKNLNAR